MTNFVFRATITEPVVMQCLETPPGGQARAVDLTGMVSVELHLKHQTDGATLCFKTTDAAPLLEVTDDGNGEVSFSPASTTFEGEAVYDGYLVTVDGDGKRTSFPSDGNFSYRVIAAFGG